VKAEAADFSETFVTMYQTAQRHVPEDRNIHCYSCFLILFACRHVAVFLVELVELLLALHVSLLFLSVAYVSSVIQNIRCNLRLLSCPS
jgi:hypothetical protein